MKIIVINGFNSFIGNSFYKKYKEKYKILKYKEDINNIQKLKLFTRKNNFDYFIHFAALSRLKCDTNKTKCKKTNYLSLKKIINHFNTLKIKPGFIFISSSHVYANSKKKLTENSKKKPNSLYGKLKLDSENYLKKNYEKYCILRLFNVYGKDQPKNFFIPDMKRKIKNNELIQLTKSIRDFIHINDVIKIIKFFVKKELYGEFNVGSGQGMFLTSIVKMISSITKIKSKIEIINKSDKLIANISKLRKVGYTFKINKIRKINLNS